MIRICANCGKRVNVKRGVFKYSYEGKPLLEPFICDECIKEIEEESEEEEENEDFLAPFYPDEGNELLEGGREVA